MTVGLRIRFFPKRLSSCKAASVEIIVYNSKSSNSFKTENVYNYRADANADIIAAAQPLHTRKNL